MIGRMASGKEGDWEDLERENCIGMIESGRTGGAAAGRAASRGAKTRRCA